MTCYGPTQHPNLVYANSCQPHGKRRQHQNMGLQHLDPYPPQQNAANDGDEMAQRVESQKRPEELRMLSMGTYSSLQRKGTHKVAIASPSARNTSPISSLNSGTILAIKISQLLTGVILCPWQPQAQSLNNGSSCFRSFW